MEALADTRSTVPHKQVMSDVQHEIQQAKERFDHFIKVCEAEKAPKKLDSDGL